MMIMKFLLASMLLVACQARILEYEITAHVNEEGNFEKGGMTRFKDPGNFKATYNFSHPASVLEILDVQGDEVIIESSKHCDLEGYRKLVRVSKDDLIALRKDDAWPFQGTRKYKSQGPTILPGCSASEYWEEEFKSDNDEIIKIVCKKGKYEYTFQCSAYTKWEFYPSDPDAPMRLITKHASASNWISWEGCEAVYDGANIKILEDNEDKVTFKNKNGGKIKKPKKNLTCVFPELRIHPINKAAKELEKAERRAERHRINEEVRKINRHRRASVQQMHAAMATKKPKKRGIGFSVKGIKKNFGKIIRGVTGQQKQNGSY